MSVVNGSVVSSSYYLPTEATWFRCLSRRSWGRRRHALPRVCLGRRGNGNFQDVPRKQSLLCLSVRNTHSFFRLIDVSYCSLTSCLFSAMTTFSDEDTSRQFPGLHSAGVSKRCPLSRVRTVLKSTRAASTSSSPSNTERLIWKSNPAPSHLPHARALNKPMISRTTIRSS